MALFRVPLACFAMVHSAFLPQRAAERRRKIGYVFPVIGREHAPTAYNRVTIRSFHVVALVYYYFVLLCLRETFDWDSAGRFVGQSSVVHLALVFTSRVSES